MSPRFDAITAVLPAGADGFLIRAISRDGSEFEFTVTKEAAASLTLKFQLEAVNVPMGATMLKTLAFVPIESEQGEPGLLIQITENFAIPLILGKGGLAALEDCTEQLRQHHPK